MTQPNLPGGLQVVGEPRPGGCGTWWRALAPNGAERGVLRLDLDGAQAGAAERLAAAVRAVNSLDYSGFLAAGEPIRHDGALWMVTSQPASPTLIELAEAGIGGIDIGSVATIANETAQSLAELHNAGLAHGWVHGQTVVVTNIGAARLAETALASALRSMPPDAAATDRRMWAELVRGMVAQWGGGDAGADLLLRCAASGEQDLAEALRVLRAGASVLPPEFAKRAGLVAAVAKFQGARGSTTVGAPAGSAVSADIPQQTRAAAPQSSTVPAPPVVHSDQYATRLARRPGGTPVVGPQKPAPVAVPRSGEEVRFGRGVGAAAPAAPAWRPPPSAPARPRRSPWRLISSVLSTLLTVVLLAVVGWYLWQRINPIEVTSVAVAVPDPPGNRCDLTVDVVATAQTNGKAGTITYQWLRSGAEPSGLLTEQVGRGQRSVTLHLKWSFSGAGTAQETATINITEPAPMQAQTSFTYNCQRP